MNDTPFNKRLNFLTVVSQCRMRMMLRLQKPKLVHLHSATEYHIYLTEWYI